MPRLPGLQEVGKINHHANAKNYTTANNQTIANERRNQWIMNTGCVDISPHDMYVCQKHFVKGKLEIPI